MLRRWCTIAALALVTVATLVACETMKDLTPRTPAERLVAAEAGFQAAVNGLAAATKVGVIKSGSALDANLKRAAVTVNGSLAMASRLLQTGQALEAEEYLQIAEGGVAELTTHWNAVKRKTGGT